MRILWVTNDLPPRTGGIQQFVANLVRRLDPDDSVVVGPDAGPAGPQHDAGEPVRVVRAPGPVLPTSAIRRLVTEVAATHDPQVIVLGASWPLGVLAGPLTRATGRPVVGLTHGLEAGLAQPITGWTVRRATRGLAAATTITDFTAGRLRPYLAAERVVALPPGVDVERFHPAVSGAPMRRAWGVEPDETLVGCISRLVPRKGQDRLIDAWPRVQARHPAARLVVVGEGPDRERLARRAERRGVHVTLPGPVDWEVLPAAYAALDLFVMPCRTRWAGLDVEGLGIVYLEAQAVGVPAVAGRSGGAPEAVRAGATGSVVDGRDPAAIADAVNGWLADTDRRRQAGREGVVWARERWSWDHIAGRLRGLLEDVVAGAPGR